MITNHSLQLTAQSKTLMSASPQHLLLQCLNASSLAPAYRLAIRLAGDVVGCPHPQILPLSCVRSQHLSLHDRRLATPGVVARSPHRRYLPARCLHRRHCLAVFWEQSRNPLHLEEETKKVLQRSLRDYHRCLHRRPNEQRRAYIFTPSKPTCHSPSPLSIVTMSISGSSSPPCLSPT